MNIVFILNENNNSECVEMNKEDNCFVVYHYVNDNLERKRRYDDFYEAVETLKKWQSYFS